MIHGGTNTRDRSGNTVVLGDLVRPDETSTLLFDCEEIAAPIRKVNCITIHGRSSRNIVAGCKHPFGVQGLHVGRADRVLCRLAPAVVQILSDYSPLARSGLI